MARKYIDNVDEIPREVVDGIREGVVPELLSRISGEDLEKTTTRDPEEVRKELIKLMADYYKNVAPGSRPKHIREKKKKR